jgi:hypothetical protein
MHIWFANLVVNDLLWEANQPVHQAQVLDFQLDKLTQDKIK